MLENYFLIYFLTLRKIILTKDFNENLFSIEVVLLKHFFPIIVFFLLLTYQVNKNLNKCVYKAIPF